MYNERLCMAHEALMSALPNAMDRLNEPNTREEWSHPALHAHLSLDSGMNVLAVFLTRVSVRRCVAFWHCRGMHQAGLALDKAEAEAVQKKLTSTSSTLSIA